MISALLPVSARTCSLLIQDSERLTIPRPAVVPVRLLQPPRKRWLQQFSNVITPSKLMKKKVPAMLSVNLGLRPTKRDESTSTCHSERSEETTSSVFHPKSRSLTPLGMTWWEPLSSTR